MNINEATATGAPEQSVVSRGRDWAQITGEVSRHYPGPREVFAPMCSPRMRPHQGLAQLISVKYPERLLLWPGRTRWQSTPEPV